jgi:hypothetical protein
MWRRTPLLFLFVASCNFSDTSQHGATVTVTLPPPKPMPAPGFSTSLTRLP